MSHASHDHDHGALSASDGTPAFRAHASDPTRTTTLRRQYGQQCSTRYRELISMVRETVVDRRYLNAPGESTLGANLGGIEFPDRVGVTPIEGPMPAPEYDFPTEAKRAERFMDWLRDAADVLVLGDDGEAVWTKQYVRYAYARGLKHAETELGRRGVDVPERQIANTFNLPVHRDTLELFFTRQFDGLKGINDAMGRQISQTLAQSFVEGVNPREAARRINTRVRKIGITRARTLARTEMVYAHNEAALNRYSRFLGEDAEVTAQVEFVTAGDRRVCPICASLDGRTYTISDARGVIPVHPRCRCAWLPV